jgi:hypothetical protein
VRVAVQFLITELGYSFIGKLFPHDQGTKFGPQHHSDREEAAGVSCVSLYIDQHYIWMGETIQGLVVYFCAIFTLEASLLCAMEDTPLKASTLIFSM